MNGDGGAEREEGPTGAADDSGGGPTDVACPFCGSGDVVREMAFGQEISKSQYYCRACETPFERIKWGDDRRPDTGR